MYRSMSSERQPHQPLKASPFRNRNKLRPPYNAGVTRASSKVSAIHNRQEHRDHRDSVEDPKSTDRSRSSRRLSGRHEKYRPKSTLQRTPWKTRRVPTEVDTIEDSVEDPKCTDQSRRSRGLRGRHEEYRRKSMLQRTP
ncbi:hypothetical protein MRX96_016171 [Rhipicephalus microplus]